MGPEPQAPPCPDGAPDSAYTGHADLDAPPGCALCACGPPSGTCGVPPTLTASSTPCPGADPGAVHTPFDPPGGWDGGCTSHDAVAGAALCQGAPCVRSLTIAPPTVNEGGCVPALPAPVPSPASWKTFVRACRGEHDGSCGKDELFCAPEGAAGFRRCVFRFGEQACSGPELGPYQEKHVVYQGYQDTRSCSPCTCGAPAGSVCTAQISIHGDDACATAPTYVETIDSTGPVCHDLTPGAPLGSKRVGPATYAPGACPPSGGAPQGTADPSNPATFCCIPSL